MEPSDELLLEHYRNGDESALLLIIKRYFDVLYRYAYRFTQDNAAAEDIVQESCIKVWRSIDSFKSGMHVKPWLFRIAHNTAIDYLRKKKATVFSSFTEDGMVESFVDTTIDILEESIVRQEKEQLTKSIEALPTHYREVLLLRAEELLTFEEIATVIDKPLNTVKSLYRRGLAILQEQLHQAAR